MEKFRRDLGHYGVLIPLITVFIMVSQDLTNVHSKLVKRQQYDHPKLLILYKVLVQSHLLKAQHGFDHQRMMCAQMNC